MPPLAGFTHNPLQSRDDFERAALVLLRSLCKHQSPGGARIRLPITSGTHFDETAADLEGFARPLWAVASLYAGHTHNEEIRDIALAFARGLKHGTDPAHEEFWGQLPGRDQRMVEMEIISFALLAAPDVFYHDQDEATKLNIKTWLYSINGLDMPAMNWLWFRIMTNLALVLVCGIPYDDLKEVMQADLTITDTFYMDDGWSSDGLWSDIGRQADYYSGSFAIQFSQLLYVRFAHDLDPIRCQTYRKRAAAFSGDFAHYFGSDGAGIPFGRSLTYRWAMAGFWSAAAYAGVPLSKEMDLSAVKGLLLRHMRWWASKPDVFYPDGTLNLGFVYTNMYMTEDYNSPQSVYWCMKTFCALALDVNDKFWQAPESPPLDMTDDLFHVARAPQQIICNNGNHLFALSAAQFCPWPLKATEAKYGKFAYSSHFGFSVPTGPLLEQQAPDSTLLLRELPDPRFVSRWTHMDPRIIDVDVHDCASGTTLKLPVLESSWKPFPKSHLRVQTRLVPSSTARPNWHFRIHTFTVAKGSAPEKFSAFEVEATESGFAIQDRTSDGRLLPDVDQEALSTDFDNDGLHECKLTSNDSALVCSRAGYTGMKILNLQNDSPSPSTIGGRVIKPDANTNLMWPRTLIPSVQSLMKFATPDDTWTLAVAVFAVARSSNGDGTLQPPSNVLQDWRSPPEIRWTRNGAIELQ